MIFSCKIIILKSMAAHMHRFYLLKYFSQSMVHQAFDMIAFFSYSFSHKDYICCETNTRKMNLIFQGRTSSHTLLKKMESLC